MNKNELAKLFCFREESARLLLLCMTQLKLSTKQSDDEVLSLTHVFQNLAAICAQLERLDASNNSEQKALFTELHEQIQDNVNQGIMSFQFYDRLSQQLDHLGESLDQLSQLIQDSETLADESKWVELRDYIFTKYTMESEQILFHAIMSGKSADAALAAYFESKTQTPDDDIELF